MGSELVEEPHIARYFVQCFGVVRPDQELLANGGIGKMAEKVGGLLGVIVIATEAQVAILVHIDAEWVPRGNNHPDTNVELPLHDQHGILDVLLDDPVLHLATVENIVVDLTQVPHYGDTSSPIQTGRLDEPKICTTVLGWHVLCQ